MRWPRSGKMSLARRFNAGARARLDSFVASRRLNLFYGVITDAVTILSAFPGVETPG